jgi:ABC-type antimicrobial peptide transport system permease subunit
MIGGFLCCLVIIQSSKEAAIMRIQGTTKRKTRVILALEQMLLSVGGLVIGVCALLVYKGMALAVISGQLYVFAALYFAVLLVSAITCAGLATRRNVLELLQTKE